MTGVPGLSGSRPSPEEAGFNPGAFDDALELASKSEIGIGSDLTSMMPDGTRHPSNRPLGPVKSRGSTSGVVVFQGQIVGEYGDIHRPEVTFSCSKSYLSALCGIAVTDGLASGSWAVISRVPTQAVMTAGHTDVSIPDFLLVEHFIKATLVLFCYQI